MPLDLLLECLLTICFIDKEYNMPIMIKIIIGVTLITGLAGCTGIRKCSQMNMAQKVVHEMIMPICNSY